MRSEYPMIATILVLAAATVCSCSCSTEAKRLLRESGESFAVLGEYVTPRERSEPPKENWIGTARLPDGRPCKLIDIPIRMPDGRNAMSPTKVTYNEPRRTLICERVDHLESDVWRMDLCTGQSRWISKGTWDATRGFAWSPDGNRIAVVASVRGDPIAFVMEYNLDTDRLEKVAEGAYGNIRDDLDSGNSSFAPRRPVYGEDGGSLYFVAMDRHVTRVDLRTRQLSMLPFANAIVVLTVKGAHLVYVRRVGSPEQLRFEVVKASLKARDGAAGEQVVYADEGFIEQSFVSPSRRYLLLTSRAGYGVARRLIDVDSGTAMEAWSLLMYNPGFREYSAVFTGGRQ